VLAQIVSYLGLGLMAGCLSGLLGVGGGVVIVPALIIISGMAIKNAIGTSLAIIIPTAIVGTLLHYREGNVNLEIAIFVAIAAIAGSRIGVYLTTITPASTLKKIFGILLILVALKMILGK